MDGIQAVKRWAIAVHEPLVPDAYRVQARQGLFRLALEDREWFCAWVAGVLSDLIYTLDPQDPWRNTHLGEGGLVLLPDGSEFGTWRNALDILPAPDLEDPLDDLGLAALVDGLSPDSAHLWSQAQQGLEPALDAMRLLLPSERYPAAMDALGWVIHRRRLFMGADDPYITQVCLQWAKRAELVSAGLPWDESGAARLREESRVEPGSWGFLQG